MLEDRLLFSPIPPPLTPMLLLVFPLKLGCKFMLNPPDPSPAKLVEEGRGLMREPKLVEVRLFGLLPKYCYDRAKPGMSF